MKRSEVALVRKRKWQPFMGCVSPQVTRLSGPGQPFSVALGHFSPQFCNHHVCKTQNLSAHWTPPARSPHHTHTHTCSGVYALYTTQHTHTHSMQGESLSDNHFNPHLWTSCPRPQHAIYLCTCMGVALLNCCLSICTIFLLCYIRNTLGRHNPMNEIFIYHWADKVLVLLLLSIYFSLSAPKHTASEVSAMKLCIHII